LNNNEFNYEANHGIAAQEVAVFITTHTPSKLGKRRLMKGVFLSLRLKNRALFRTSQEFF
jgi:hypothetical protein